MSQCTLTCLRNAEVCCISLWNICGHTVRLYKYGKYLKDAVRVSLNGGNFFITWATGLFCHLQLIVKLLFPDLVQRKTIFWRERHWEAFRTFDKVVFNFGLIRIDRKMLDIFYSFSKEKENFRGIRRSYLHNLCGVVKEARCKKPIQHQWTNTF